MLVRKKTKHLQMQDVAACVTDPARENKCEERSWGRNGNRGDVAFISINFSVPSKLLIHL